MSSPPKVDWMGSQLLKYLRIKAIAFGRNLYLLVPNPLFPLVFNVTVIKDTNKQPLNCLIEHLEEEELKVKNQEVKEESGWSNSNLSGSSRATTHVTTSILGLTSQDASDLDNRTKYHQYKTLQDVIEKCFTRSPELRLDTNYRVDGESLTLSLFIISKLQLFVAWMSDIEAVGNISNADLLQLTKQCTTSL